MPKLIILFFGAESSVLTLAAAAADGARGVRFTEVELRSGALDQGSSEGRHKRLESATEVREFDGVILVRPATGDIPSEMIALLDELELSSPGALTNTVIGIPGGEDTSLAGRVVRLGAILVSESPGPAAPEARAARLGARVATVAGWVRHALNHEEEHRHAAHHEH
jgi:hypothetical protein